VLGLLLTGRTDGLEAHDIDEQARVLVLDGQLDLVKVLTTGEARGKRGGHRQ
jgi:hypothetical protein